MRILTLRYEKLNLPIKCIYSKTRKANAGFYHHSAVKILNSILMSHGG